MDVSGPIQLAKSEIVGGLRIGAIGYSDGYVPLEHNQRISAVCGRTSAMGLAPPDVMETYCNSRKRRTYALLCSWQ